MHDGEMEYGVDLTKEWLQEQDCVVLLTDHQVYDYDFVLEHSRLVVDTRNAINGSQSSTRVVKLGSPIGGLR
jgi:UDP-N-acetyl-D-glucosamine dehydrogenase